MNGTREDRNLTFLKIANETYDFIGKIVIPSTYFNIKNNIPFSDFKNVPKFSNLKIAYMIDVFIFKTLEQKAFL